MAARTRIVIVHNGIPNTCERIKRSMERRVPQVADEMRDELVKALTSGALPLQPDTAAMAEGLAVQTADGSDFGERRQASKDAYLNNPSLWKEPVRERFGETAYTEAHFEARAATNEPPLAQDQEKARAAILCLVAWGLLWEYGHYNQFTGRSEHRPWFVPYLETWFATNATRAFSGLAK